MKPRLVLAASALCSLAVFVACGGASESELFGSPESSQLANEPSGETSSGGSSSLPGAGSTSSSSSSSSASSGSSSGGSSSGGSTSSGSSGSTADAGATTDAGAKTTSVWCGEDEDGDDVHCGAGQICCGKHWNYGPKLACAAAGPASCTGGLAIGCDDQTDCPTGQVCCGSFVEGAGYTSVTCAPSCNSVPGVRAVRFCDGSAAVDECKAIGKDCESSQALPGYAICK